MLKHENSRWAFACSKLTIKKLKHGVKLRIKTPERRQSRPSGVFILNSEHISQLVLVVIADFVNLSTRWVVSVNLSKDAF